MFEEGKKQLERIKRVAAWGVTGGGGWSPQALESFSKNC